MTTTDTRLGEYLHATPTGVRSHDDNAALAVAVAAISSTIRRASLPAPVDITTTDDASTLVVTLHGGSAALLAWRDALGLEGDVAVQLTRGGISGAATGGVFERVHVELRTVAAVTP